VLIPGIVVGVLWLMPVFTPPASGGGEDQGFALARFVRVLSVGLILPVVAGRLPSMLARERVLRLAAVGFLVLPLLSVVNFPVVAHLVATVGPYVVGGGSLLCLAALRDAEFRAWLQGVGLAAAAFVAVGVARYGFEATTYYGRPRVHLGFVHPTQSASALCAAALFAATVLAATLRRRPVLRRTALTGLVVATGAMLVLVSSRNTFLLLCAMLLFAGYARAVRSPLGRFVAFASVVALFPAMMWFALRADVQSAAWQIANLLGSARFIIYRRLLAGLADEDAFSLLFGPTYVLRELKENATGFAAADSTYLTILLNYGVVTTLAFYAFWLLVGARLCRRGGAVAYGVFCSVSLYLLLDAQGVTPSNMLVFGMLAYSVRAALRREATRAGQAAMPADAGAPG
jgi:O-antigen ligase